MRANLPSVKVSLYLPSLMLPSCMSKSERFQTAERKGKVVQELVLSKMDNRHPARITDYIKDYSCRDWVSTFPTGYADN